MKKSKSIENVKKKCFKIKTFSINHDVDFCDIILEDSLEEHQKKSVQFSAQSFSFFTFFLSYQF